jgi:hypothetical protein
VRPNRDRKRRYPWRLVVTFRSGTQTRSYFTQFERAIDARRRILANPELPTVPFAFLRKVMRESNEHILDATVETNPTYVPTGNLLN